MSDYIKLSRKILDWDWYTDVNTCHLFLHMLLKANWKDGRFEGIEVPRGSLVTSTNKLSKETRSDPYKVVAKRVKKPEGKEWQRSLQIARQALNGDFIRKFKGATHFYNINTDNPKWKERLLYIAQAGPFILMKLKDT